MQNLDEDYRRGYSCYKAKENKDLCISLSFIFIPLLTKTTDYVLGLFHQGKFAGSLLVKILLAHS